MPEPRNNLAMVALRQPVQPDWDAVAIHQRRNWPDVGVDRLERDGGVATAAIPGGQIGLAHMPMPIPWGDLEWPARVAWHWQGASEALRAHESHVVAFASSDCLSPVDLNLALTRSIASIVATTEAVGVYYGNASLVIESQRYLDEAIRASVVDFPIMLWIGFHPVRESLGLSAYTTGMEIFGLLNLEVHDSPLEPADLLGLLANVASYEIETNVQIGDGETVGGSPDERIGIQHRASRFGNQALSCQLVHRETVKHSNGVDILNGSHVSDAAHLKR